MLHRSLTTQGCFTTKGFLKVALYKGRAVSRPLVLRLKCMLNNTLKVAHLGGRLQLKRVPDKIAPTCTFGCCAISHLEHVWQRKSSHTRRQRMRERPQRVRIRLAGILELLDLKCPFCNRRLRDCRLRDVGNCRPGHQVDCCRPFLRKLMWVAGDVFSGFQEGTERLTATLALHADIDSTIDAHGERDFWYCSMLLRDKLPTMLSTPNSHQYFHRGGEGGSLTVTFMLTQEHANVKY